MTLPFELEKLFYEANSIIEEATDRLVVREALKDLEIGLDRWFEICTCAECDDLFSPSEEGQALCWSCREWENQKAQDHRDELESYHLVSVGVG